MLKILDLCYCTFIISFELQVEILFSCFLYIMKKAGTANINLPLACLFAKR